MSLLRCPDCGRGVSSAAMTCPHCGRPASILKKQRPSNEVKKRTCRINGQLRELKKGKNFLCKINGRQYNLKPVEDAIRANNIGNANLQVVQITNLSFVAAEKLVSLIQTKGEIPLEFDPAQYGVESNLPQCPTCGSTSLDKITAFDRGVAGGLFGFASKTARSQFRCKKCGYMW